MSAAVAVRRILALTVLAAVASPARAEPTAAPPALFEDPDPVGFFTGLTITQSLLEGGTVSGVSGGGAGVVLYHRLFLKGVLYGTPSPGAVPDHPDHELTYGYGGGVVAWIVPHLRPLHVMAGSLVGFATADLRERGTGATTGLTFAAIEPFVDVDVTVFRYLRVFVGLGYRVLLGDDAALTVDRAYLSAPTLHFGFNAGAF